VAALVVELQKRQLGGVEAAKIIREIDPDIKVIFVTGYSKDEERIGDLESNAVIVHKPYYINNLSRIIRDQLETQVEF